jgi:hypothetical protein
MAMILGLLGRSFGRFGAARGKGGGGGGASTAGQPIGLLLVLTKAS